MSLLDQFNFLRNSNPKNRQDATLRIFAILDIDSKPVRAISSAEDMRELYGEDVQYTFERLVRGLTASRESARLGFSAALSELLRALPLIDSAMVLEAIEKATTPVGKTKGQETRDFQFGRLFGLQALCTSGLLTRSNTTMEEITPVLVLLYELALSKGWLRESCASVILQLLVSTKKANPSLTQECARTIDEMLQTSGLTKTIEGIAIALQCRFCGCTSEAKVWPHQDILHADNLSAIDRVMRDLTAASQEGVGDEDKQSGNYKPKVHFTWLMIIRAILDSTEETHIDFKDFWRIVVDEGLFSAGASHERKFWGFQLFTVLIEEISEKHVLTLLSPNFLRTLSNQIVQDDRYLHKAAKSCTAAMVVAGRADPSKAFIVLQALWNFNLYFDRLSKDTTCKSLMLSTPSARLKALVTELIQHCNPQKSKIETPIKEVEKRRQYISDCFLIMLRSNLKRDGIWEVEILDFFTLHGYFDITKAKKSPFVFEPELTQATKTMFQTRLSSALGHLMPGSISLEGQLYVAHVVSTIASYRSKKYFVLSLKPDDTILALLDTAEKRLEKLVKKKSSSNQQEQSLAFILLYSLTIIQIYTGESDAMQVLSELDECYSRLFKDVTTESSEQDPLEALTDLLLSFLSRESVLFRKLVESVFTVFMDRMTEGSLNLLINVLTTDESGQGIFDTNDDDDDDSNITEQEEQNTDEEDDSDESSTSSDSDNAPSDDDDDNDDEQETERDTALDAALTSALGGRKRKASALELNPSGEGHESDFEADSDEEEDLLDDEQMLAMDATLENIFKRRKQETASTKKVDREVLKTSTIQFKRKVLDLLESFIKHCPSSPLILNLLVPLLQSARKTNDQSFAVKVQTLVRQVTKQKVLPVIMTGPDTLLPLLDTVHEESERGTKPPQVTTCSQVSLFLSRIILSLDDTQLSEIVQRYGRLQMRWMDRKTSRLNPSFFIDFINWSTQWRLNRHKAKPATGRTQEVQETKQQHAKRHTKKGLPRPL